MKLAELEKYLGVVSLILIISMSVCFGISLYNMGSGIRPRLKKIEGDIRYLVVEDTENSYAREILLPGHTHERAENNKAVFKN